MTSVENSLKVQVDKDKVRILYVDDEENNLTAFKATYRRDFTVFTAISGSEGRLVLEQEEINIIITDQRMPHMTGVEFLASILPDYPQPIRILLTGFADIEAVINAINLGQVYRYITKPWDAKELMITILNAYEIWYLRQENVQLTKDLLEANDKMEFMLRQSLLS
jgi:response regulator RpfG family c-di-GMP phosphodiesterase